MYAVLTIDVKQSTELSPEQMHQANKEIKTIIQEIPNHTTESIIAIGFTAGDEFEIILENLNDLNKVIYFLRANLSVEFRLGVGTGTVENKNPDKDPSQMWGTAFQKAREALDKAKERDMQVHIETGEDELDAHLNTIIELICFIRASLTQTQRRILDQYNYQSTFLGLETQRELADRLNISDAMVSKTLKKTGYEFLRNGERLVQRLLLET